MLGRGGATGFQLYGMPSPIARHVRPDSVMHSDTRLQFIIDAVPALIAYVDNEERYQFNNHAYEQWFGRPRSEVYGRTVREILGETAYAAIAPHVRAALSGRVVTFDDSLVYREGKTRHVRATYVPHVGDDGVVRGLVALVNDITDHKHADEDRRELRRRTAELARTARTLTESLNVSEVAKGIGQSVLPLFRARAAVLWLLQPDTSLACMAIAGEWLEHFKPGDVLPPGIGLVGRAVLERRALWTPDLVNEPGVVLTDEFRRSVANAGHHAVVAVPLRVKGEIIGAMSTAHSERRTFSPAEIDLLQAFADQGALAMRNVELFAREQAARTEAEAANRAKDQFLALLAHELRNPLAPILTSAVIIRRNRPAPAIERAANIVERQARHLGRLLDDLLDVSRITRGMIELRCETVALAEAVTDALEAARPLIDEAGHAVSVSLPSSPVYVEADATRLEQIVVNILNNAAKYTPAKGRITVNVAEEAGEGVLRIRDNGVGISAEMLPRIFDLFAQDDQSLARTSGGLGIGLTLVHRLVELHGGRVSVYSDGIGRGSEFTIRLPLSGTAGNAFVEAVSAPDRCPACAVLIIEDNADARESLRSLLEHEGHRVDATADGSSGLARAETSRPDVVLIDIGLPVMDGYEVARRIRARDAKVILVAVSGYGQADDRQRSLEAGFDAHLTKPVDPDQLLATLARLDRRGPDDGHEETSRPTP